MKKIYLLMILLLTNCFAKAQNDTIFFDDFHDNKNNWSTENSENAYINISNDRYVFKNLTTGRLFTSRNFAIDMLEDFTVEAELLRTWALFKFDSFGLAWGIKDRNNMYTFLIKVNGKYLIEKLDTYWNPIVNETVCPFINKGNNALNKLKITKENDTFFFYINDNKVYEMPSAEINGKGIGFISDGLVNIEIEKILITGKTIEIKEDSSLNDEVLIIKNLGSGINTISTEFKPTISADGKRLYFTGEKRIGGLGSEDIFMSELIDSNWSEAKIISSKINTASNAESVNAISADGNRLLFFGNYSQSFGKGDIFYSDKTDKGWGPVQHFPEPINSKNFDGDSYLTSDGKAILFVSTRKGGIGSFIEKTSFSDGNTDIYICLKEGNDWSDPINPGIIINTPGSERTPFLHPDGKTLYFSSNGRQGYGGFDVFKATRLNDTLWTKWSEPVNLGKNINSTGDDYGYRISTNGDLAYFSSPRAGGFGSSDIYSITLPKIAKPEAVVTINGIVTDENNIPLEAEIKWDNLTTQKSAGELKSDPENGAYFIVLPLGKNYGYFAEKEGYYSASNNIDLTIDTTSQNITVNIILHSVEKLFKTETPIVIENVFFDFNMYELKPESFPELERLSKILISNPDKKVEIAGYTDNVGTNEYNNKLSLNRATAVVNYLILKGCNQSKIAAKGFGPDFPIASNETEEGRARNRRVELKFIK